MDTQQKRHKVERVYKKRHKPNGDSEGRETELLRKNTNEFVYVKFLLYLCARNCKMGN